MVCVNYVVDGGGGITSCCWSVCACDAIHVVEPFTRLGSRPDVKIGKGTMIPSGGWPVTCLKIHPKNKNKLNNHHDTRNGDGGQRRQFDHASERRRGGSRGFGVASVIYLLHEPDASHSSLSSP